MRRPALLLFAALAALTAPGAAVAQQHDMSGTGGMGHDPGGSAAPVAMLFGSYSPPRLDVVAGDTVIWHNSSIRKHTATAIDGSWTSPPLATSQSFSRRFDVPGPALYYCTLHPGIRGEIDVHQVLLAPATEPGGPGAPYTLSGRTSLPEGETVAIEADEGDGYAPVEIAGVAADGSFRVTVMPRTTTTYRAVVPGEASPPVQVLVLDRRVAVAAALHGRRTAIVAGVEPASPGATVVLQLRLRNRFGWWPVRRARLDRNSRARFVLRLRHRVHARVVLTQADGATVLARGPTLMVGPSPRSRSQHH